MTPKPHSRKRHQDPSTRRPKAGPGEPFAVTAEVLYNQAASLQELARSLDLSPTSIKRILSDLREKHVLSGRVGSLRFNLPALSECFPSFCSAIISAEPDVRRLKSIAARRGRRPYSDEKGLVMWLCTKLPRTPDFRNKVIVERGCILIGARDRGIEITVHAVSTNALFDFAMLGVETADGVIGTRTLMAAYSVAVGELSDVSRKRTLRRPRMRGRQTR